jgi:hypothetical protein
MKLILRFLILVLVFGFSQSSYAFSAENLKTKKNLQKTNYQFNELQMNQIICNDSLFVAELSFVAVDPSPWGYIVVVDGMFYSFELFSDSLVQTFTLEINDPSLGSEIFVEVIDGNLIVESSFLLECDAPCSIGEPMITVLDCNDSLGVFSVELDFEYENVESAQFEVHGNATHYGTFHYSDLPIIIDGFEGNGDFVYELIVHDYEDESCSSGYGFFGPVSCPQVMNDCITFEDFDLEYYSLPFPAVEFPLGTFQNVGINAIPLESGNPNFPDPFFGGLGIFDSDNNPIGQVSGNVVSYESVILEFDFANFLGGSVQTLSFQYVSFDAPVAFGINSDDYEILPSYSQLNNNIPGLDINVSSTSVGGVEIGTVVIQGDVSNLIIASGLGYIDNICFSYMEDLDCELSNLELSVTDCDTSDELNFSFDFDYSGVNEEGFLLVGFNNDYFAQFDYADLPVTIDDLGTEIQENYSFGILTLGSPDTCHIDLDFETPACYLDNPCEITPINYSIVDCNPLDSTFYVNVWFEYDNLDSLTVSIFGGGYDWGEFDALEQPIQLGPFYGDQDVYEVIIQDTYDSECYDVLGVDSPSCLYTDCQLSALEVDIEYCSDSIVNFDASFLAENTVSSVYNIILNGEFYGYYQYSATNNEQTFEFAIEDPQFGTLVTLELFDEDDVSCATAIEFVLEPCSNDCNLSDLEVNVEYCTDSIVFLDASFLAENVDPSFVYNIYLNEEFYGYYQYSATNNEQIFDFAIEDPQFGSLYTLEIVDEDDVSCATAIEFVLEPCSNDCNLSDLEVNVEYCTDSIVFLDASFLAENVDPSFVYNIYLNEEFYGYYQYSATNNEQIFDFAIEDPQFGSLYTLEIVDEDDVSCATAIEFVLEPCSNDCSINAVEYEIVDCNPMDSTFYVNVWFEYDNLDSLTVSIFGEGYDWGEFDAWEQPVTLGPYYGDQGAYEVIIQDTYDPECYDVLGVDSPSCLYTDCQLSALEVDIEYCSDSIVNFDASFLAENTVSSVYNIILNGEFYGYYQYSATNNEQIFDFAIEDPQFGSLYTLEIVDEDDVSCATAIEFVLEPCSNDCNLIDLEVNVEYCTDSIVFLDASFLAENVDPSFVYNIYLNEEFYGYYQYSATNNEQIFDFAIEDPQFGSLYTLEIVDEDDVSCATATEFVLEPCANDCSINALEYEIVDCNPMDSTFYVNVWFEYDNLDSLTVSIFGEGYDWGEFDAWEQPVTLGPYYGDQGAYEVIIQDTYDSECYDVLGVDSPSCLYTDCQLSALEVDIEYCSDSIVNFDASFLAENTVASVYNIILNGEFYGYYQYSATNNEQTFEFAIEDPEFGTLVTLELFDEDDVSCATAIEFVLEPCSNDCNLIDLEVNVEYCTDSIVFLDASFLAENVDPSFVYNIYLNEEFYGYYQYSATNNEQIFDFAIEDPQFGSLYTLEIVDEDDVSCATAIEFVLEPCSNDCSINAVEYEIVDCNPMDSTFYVNVWFEYDNLDSLTVSIFGEGYDWGEFDAWEQPVTLGPYYGDQGAYEVIIQDTYDSECYDVLGVDSPSCLYTDCEIEWAQYEVVDCNPLDSSFYLDVWFDNSNLDLELVSIFGGGYDWGEFDASEQPVQLGPFIGIESVYEVIIQNTNDPACFNVLAVDSPSCFYTDCYVDITDYNIECVGEDSIFFVELFIDIANLSSDSLSIYGGGYDWGEFAAGLESITVGPYFIGEDVYEILVSDSSDPDCVSFIEFDEPDCTDACDLDIIEYNIVECSETDSLFYLEVFFEYDNLLGDAVAVFGGGYNWGIFNPALQPILIGPFFTGENEYEIIVADQLDLDCYDVVGFEFNGCDEDCELIEEIWIVEGPDCEGDLCEIEIGVDLSQAGSGESVDIHLNGFSYYDYPPSQLSGESFTFLNDNTGNSLLVVCISGALDCCDTLNFDLPPNGTAEVWPGDANSDNIANNIDLLYIGLANGFQGLERPEGGIEWDAYESENWPFNFPESIVNFKHADSNGDAVVDENDINAIYENYGLTHGVYEPDSTVGSIGDPPLFVDLPSFVEPGQLIQADLDLGVVSNQVSDLYGIAFTLEFPEDVFEENNIEFDFSDSWVGGSNDLYTLVQPVEGAFEFDITLVRNDQNNANENYGRIGSFIGVIDDVLGLQQVNVRIKNVYAISKDETKVLVDLPIDTMVISSTSKILDENKIHVYPIPTNKFLYLETDISNEVLSMEILDASGVQVDYYDGFESRLDLRPLLNGIYLLRVKTSEGVYQERIMIFN